MKTLFSFILISAIAFSVGCNKKNVKKEDIKKAAETTDETVEKVEDISSSVITSSSTLEEVPNANEADIRNPEFTSHEGIKTITFDFDKYELTPEAIEILSANAGILKEKKLTVLIEGHCDERGTVEYNLALGQKRANVVKDYYIRLGVPENSIGTISYGEENPLCNESSQECWAKNRRAETKVNIQ